MDTLDWTNQLFTVPPDAWQVELVVTFDWQDGPRQGFCRLASPDCCFRFELIAERVSAYDDDSHLFKLSSVSRTAFDSLLVGMKPLSPPKSGLWVPRWIFSSSADRDGVEAAVDLATSLSQPTSVIVQTHNMLDFSGAWLEIAAQP